MLSRRELLERGAKLALGTVALRVPEVLYRSPWTALASAQTLPHIESTFHAAAKERSAASRWSPVTARRDRVGARDRMVPPAQAVSLARH